MGVSYDVRYLPIDYPADRPWFLVVHWKKQYLTSRHQTEAGAIAGAEREIKTLTEEYSRTSSTHTPVYYVDENPLSKMGKYGLVAGGVVAAAALTYMLWPKPTTGTGAPLNPASLKFQQGQRYRVTLTAPGTTAPNMANVVPNVTALLNANVPGTFSVVSGTSAVVGTNVIITYVIDALKTVDLTNTPALLDAGPTSLGITAVTLAVDALGPTPNGTVPGACPPGYDKLPDGTCAPACGPGMRRNILPPYACFTPFGPPPPPPPPPSLPPIEWSPSPATVGIPTVHVAVGQTLHINLIGVPVGWNWSWTLNPALSSEQFLSGVAGPNFGGPILSIIPKATGQTTVALTLTPPPNGGPPSQLYSINVIVP